MNSSAYLATTWFDSRLILGRSAIHGHGLFASAPIRADEALMIWGGTAYSAADLRAGKVPRGASYSFIDEDLLLVAPADGLDYYVNHSCDPNLWMGDEVTVLARRDIAAGVELCGDYAVWESEPAYILTPCGCGTAQCRTTISGNDWRRLELQVRYRDHFLPFLNRRIAKLHAQG
jgi:uncharacterized protein